MTREEAIKRIENLIKGRKDPRGKTELDIALDMAIEALKEMPVEEYRQRLMDVFHRTDHDELLTYVVQPKEEEFKSLEDILRQYKFEPRPHGGWIPMITKDDYGEQVLGYKCKTCGWLKSHDKMPFCENCGADMRKEGEAE